METCSVIHWGQFVDYLIYAGLLKEVDAETPARIEKATDALLEHRVQEWAPLWQGCKRDWVGKQTVFNYVTPHPWFKGLPCDGEGTVRVRVSMLLVEALGLESECDNRRKIRTAIESLLFVCYSNFADREIPDPWPTRGPVQWRPVFAPTKTHTTRHLRSIGMLSGKDGTRFHQDEWFAPKDHESQKPGSMFEGTE
jgi:hypothetical protein